MEVNHGSADEKTGLFHATVIIGIPLYNEELYIEETLNSILSQTYSDFLVLISDNNSTDRSSDICLSYQKKDSRIHYIRLKSNIGALRNFEFLLNSTSSPFFMWLGAHDSIHPTFLAKHINKLKNNDKVSLSCSMIKWIDEDGKTTKLTHLSHVIRYKMPDWMRYLITVTSVPDDEYVVFNSLFRRVFMKGYCFKPTFGIDHIIVSRLNYMGEVNYETEALYIAREFNQKRDESWAERVNPEKPNDCYNMSLFKRVFDEDFTKLINQNRTSTKIALKSLFHLCLGLRIMKNDYDYGSSVVRPFLLFVFVKLLRSCFPRKTGTVSRLKSLAQHHTDS